MTIQETISLFSDELAGSYPPSEIDAICRIVLEHVTGLSYAGIYLNAGQRLPEQAKSQIYNIIYQLKRNVPVQYVLGETEFYGLRFIVNENVLIPRPETEELVEWIITDYKKEVKTIRILDIGTGSGCIPVALARSLPSARMSAVDISAGALGVARQNAALNRVHVEFTETDVLQGLPASMGRFDVMVSNPPYISPEQKQDMLPNVLQYEPHLALFARGDNPLVFYEVIANLAANHLEPGGNLYFEINEKYPVEITRMLELKGFKTTLKADINNKSRMIKAWMYDKG